MHIHMNSLIRLKTLPDLNSLLILCFHCDFQERNTMYIQSVISVLEYTLISPVLYTSHNKPKIK